MHLSERVNSKLLIEHQDVQGIDLSDRFFLDSVIRFSTFTRCSMRHSSFATSRVEHCRFRGCDLSHARFDQASIISSSTFDDEGEMSGVLRDARFDGTKLAQVDFGPIFAERADFNRANLNEVTFRGTKLARARFIGSRLTRVNFLGTSLKEAVFVRNSLTNCKLDEVLVTGVAAWNNKYDEASSDQQRCIIDDHLPLRIRNIETAQLIDQVCDGKFANAVNEMTGCAVLLLGRFDKAGRERLDVLRRGLEEQGYLPLIFEFVPPTDRTVTETVVLLAHMVKFIVADLSDPRSVGHELRSIIPTLGVPVVPVISANQDAYSMFGDYWRYDWVLDIVRYGSTQELADILLSRIISPALGKAEQIDARRKKHLRAAADNRES
ncbi:MAG: pentapeptide repeat-containing protein [Pseudomarimonas sp.]